MARGQGLGRGRPSSQAGQGNRVTPDRFRAYTFEAVDWRPYPPEEKRMKNMFKGALALIALPTLALAAEPIVAACCAACAACTGCGFC